MFRDETAVQTFGINPTGNDFICGDIHGCFDQLEALLERVSFRPEVDRMFCAGDLVDRGAYSEKSMEYLAKPWFFSVRGNHEQMIINAGISPNGVENEDQYHAKKNGADWWFALSVEQQRRYLSKFSSLPFAIEVTTTRGTVGIVHADIPRGLSWQQFLARLNEGCEITRTTAIWGRSRIRNQNREGVSGIDRIFVGHTILDTPTKLGNVYAVDTGAYLNLMEGMEPRLSLAHLAFKTGLISDPVGRSKHGSGEFGSYAQGPAQ